MRICFFCRPQLCVILLWSPDSLTTIIHLHVIKIRIQFIRQCDEWACFTFHNSAILRAICDKQTRRSDSTFSLDIYLKMPSHIKKKDNTCIDATIMSLALIHRQARVTFHNIAEVKLRDFLLTGQTFKSERMIGLVMVAG